jgi:hypothetical protein
MDYLPPRMSSLMRYAIVGFAAAVTTGVALLTMPSGTPEDPIKNCSNNSDSGSAYEAFDISCKAMKEYISTLELGPISFDPHYRALLLSQSRTWTIKGYASCPDINKSYRWTVILSFHGGQEWEVLEKIVTPEFTAPDGNQTDGVARFQGKLIPADSR